jgi:hypothetical protein
MTLALPPLKPMAQSRRGLTQVLDAKEHPLAKTIPGFIQIHMPLLLLKLMAQLRRGETQNLEAEKHPLTKAISKLSHRL